jgi:hypothetical protein
MCCAEPEVKDTEDDQNELTGSYTFAQLSDKAKENARNENRDWNVDEGWWDYTYEDAVRMGAMLGIEIGTRQRKTTVDIDINFQGFCSQGDHASFAGSYRCRPDAVKLIEAECNDEELIRIAKALTTLQVTAKMLYDDQIEAKITHHRGRGVNVEVMAIDEPAGSVNKRPGSFGGTDVTEEEDKEVRTLMDDFATWIYDQLEATYDHLTSDEAVEEALADRLFDGDGTLII